MVIWMEIKEGGGERRREREREGGNERGVTVESG